MSSYAGENTSKQRQMDRIDARNRKSIGRGAHKRSNSVDIDPKEARAYVPRHLEGTFEQLNKLEETLMTDDLTRIVLTSFSVNRFAHEGIPSTLRNDPPKSEDPNAPKIVKTFEPLRIKITDSSENAHFRGDTVVVRPTGFTILRDGKEEKPSTDIWSLNVRVAGPFGYHIKFDNRLNKLFVS